MYRKLIAESPDAHTLHYNLGLICTKLNRLEDAESAFLKALDLTRGNPKINFYLGSIYERTNRFKDAIYQYRQAGASLMVQRVEGKMGTPPPSNAGGADEERPDTRPPGPLNLRASLFETPRAETRDAPAAQAPPPSPGGEADGEPSESDEAALVSNPKTVEPVSAALMAEKMEGLTNLNETARFQVFDDTLPPGGRLVRRSGTRRRRQTLRTWPARTTERSSAPSRRASWRSTSPARSSSSRARSTPTAAT